MATVNLTGTAAVVTSTVVHPNYIWRLVSTVTVVTALLAETPPLVMNVLGNPAGAVILCF